MRALLDREFALLALRLDRRVPGLIESFTGDPGLARLVAAEPRHPPAQLVRAAGRLRAEIDAAGLPPARHAFLAGEARALELAARVADGARPSLREEIAETFGIVAEPGLTDVYRAAHRSLDAALPGRGPLASRLAAYRRRDDVPRRARAAAVAALVEALRQRAVEVLGPGAGDGEVAVEIVDGEPWSGFTRHVGAGRSLTRFAGDVPVRAGQLARLVAHETYPGHHTEHVLRARAARDPARTVSLTRGPRALVVEGAADHGLDVVVGPGWGRWAADVLASAGVVTDGDLAEHVDAAMAPLQRVRLDAALLLHGPGGGPDAAAAHLHRWLLVDDARARRMLDFLADPRWRAYTVTYVEGLPLVTAWTGRGAGAAGRFRRLLAEPLVPAVLTAAPLPRTDGDDTAERAAPGRDRIPDDRDGRCRSCAER